VLKIYLITKRFATNKITLVFIFLIQTDFLYSYNYFRT